MSEAVQELPPIFYELERCKKWIEDALERSGDTHDYKDVVDAVLSGEMMLWSDENSCIIGTICKHPKKTTLHLFLGAGDLDEITDIVKNMEIFAKEAGCDALTLSGRYGWKRAFKDMGWEQQFVSLQKDI